MKDSDVTIHLNTFLECYDLDDLRQTWRYMPREYRDLFKPTKDYLKNQMTQS